MTRKHLLIGPLAAAALLFVPTVNAQPKFYTLNLRLTAWVQGEQTDDGQVTTSAPMRTHVYTTESILQHLAEDEFAAGNWASNRFPKGAKLAVDEFFNYFVIQGTSALLNVSSIMRSGGEDTATITWGKKNLSTDVPQPTMHLLTLRQLGYDNSNIPGASPLNFYVTGMESFTRTYKRLGNGLFEDTARATVIHCSGEGSDDAGKDIVLSGSFSFSGKGTEPLPPPQTVATKSAPVRPTMVRPKERLSGLFRSVDIEITIYAGSAPFVDGEIVVQPPPRVRHIRNADILARANRDRVQSGLEPFPKTAELAYNGENLLVVNKGEGLAVVFDIDTGYGGGVDSGRMDDETGLAAPWQKRIEPARISYQVDSTWFVVDGIMTERRVDSTPEPYPEGRYREIIAGEFTSGAGYGYSDADGPLIATCRLRSGGTVSGPGF
jgi:hypothetical protein